MPVARRLLILSVLACLAGCPIDPVKEVKPPPVVYVTVTKYVPVPDELTQPCPIAEPKTLAVEQVVEVANARKTALQNCNEDKKAIKALQVPDPTDPQKVQP